MSVLISFLSANISPVIHWWFLRVVLHVLSISWSFSSNLFYCLSNNLHNFFCFSVFQCFFRQTLMLLLIVTLCFSEILVIFASFSLLFFPLFILVFILFCPKVSALVHWCFLCLLLHVLLMSRSYFEKFVLMLPQFICVCFFVFPFFILVPISFISIDQCFFRHVLMLLVIVTLGSSDIFVVFANLICVVLFVFLFFILVLILFYPKVSPPSVIHWCFLCLFLYGLLMSWQFF